MQRWHLTIGLAALALGAGAIAPRLMTRLQPAPPAPKPPITRMVVPPPIHEPMEPVEPLQVVDDRANTGHLRVEASLDLPAVLQGASSDRFLTVTITAPADLGQAKRRPLDVAVVMDTSGSMAKQGKIDYARRAAKLVASSMEPGDTFSLVTFNDDATVIVPAGPVGDPAALHRAIDRVQDGGGTNLYAGLSKAADEVRRSVGDNQLARVILLSDGNANVGVTDPDAMARFSATLSGEGFTVSTIGLGLDYNEDLLARMADVGSGTYDFVDDPRTLETVFAEELTRSASVVARSTQVQVELPPGVRGLELLGWDAARTERGWTIPLGDVYAGTTRKIVARVRMDGTLHAGTQPVATASAHYRDLVDDIDAQTQADATATVTNDANLISTRSNRNAAIEANRAFGNTFLDRSAREYAAGNQAEARRLALEGEQVLQQAATQYGDDGLMGEAADLRQQADVYESYAPTSVDGKRAIKLGKELFRGRSR